MIHSQLSGIPSNAGNQLTEQGRYTNALAVKLNATAMADKRVCIIGAGPSGLTAIKACIEEGLEPICYEKTSDLGGLWKYRSENEDDVSSVMKSTIINSSKEISAYSDFPPPDDFPNFMHNERMAEYLGLYAKKFNLARHIHFNSSVIQVSKQKDYISTGRWEVQVKDKDGTIANETFDAVMVCIGHHVYPKVPTFTGLDTFKGQVIHTHKYKTPDGFQDKRVLVIGIGNSGGDAAVELSRVAKQVYLSTRKGSWVLNRVDYNGIPMDINLITRMLAGVAMQYLPWTLVNSFLETKLNWRFDHSLYGLKPRHRVFEQHPMVNDDLPNRILSGTLTVKEDIDHFTENGVCFKDSNTVYEVDTVIMATGYDIKFPFLTSDIVLVDDNEVSLYKFVFPPHDEPATLAVIGLIQPFGSILPISEMQCRWATKVFKGDCKLPKCMDMFKDITKTRQAIKERYVASQRHTIQVDYVTYNDQLAKMIGAMPNMKKLFLKDPQLLMHCMFGPCYPYQYRLNGPHAWPGAVDAIFTAKKRVLAPLKTREPNYVPDDTFWTNLIAPIWAIIVFIVVLFTAF